MKSLQTTALKKYKKNELDNLLLARWHLLFFIFNMLPLHPRVLFLLSSSGLCCLLHRFCLTRLKLHLRKKRGGRGGERKTISVWADEALCWVYWELVMSAWLNNAERDPFTFFNNPLYPKGRIIHYDVKNYNVLITAYALQSDGPDWYWSFL